MLVWVCAETSDGPGNRQWGTSLSLDFKISQLLKPKTLKKNKARAGSEGNCHRWIRCVCRDFPNIPHRKTLKPSENVASNLQHSSMTFNIYGEVSNSQLKFEEEQHPTSYLFRVQLRNPSNSFIRTVWVQFDWHQLTTWASSCHQVSIELLLNPDWCMGVHEIPFSHLTPPTSNQ